MLFWKCVSSSRRRRSSSSWPCSVILNWKKQKRKTKLQIFKHAWNDKNDNNSFKHITQSFTSIFRSIEILAAIVQLVETIGADMSMAAHETTTHLCLCVCSFWRLWGFLLTQVSESLTKENQLFQPFEFTRPECAENNVRTQAPTNPGATEQFYYVCEWGHATASKWVICLFTEGKEEPRQNKKPELLL